MCQSDSGYDKESLKASTHNINGIKHILCCPCEDDLKKKLNKNQIARLKKWLKDHDHLLMSDDIDDLKYIIQELEAKYY
jgi:hypothetical protein